MQLNKISLFSAEELPHWVLSAMKCLANCKYLLFANFMKLTEISALN